jgi:hypothetical protein
MNRLMDLYYYLPDIFPSVSGTLDILLNLFTVHVLVIMI